MCADLSYDTDHRIESRGESGVSFVKVLHFLVGDKENVSLLINDAIIDLSLKKDRIHWLLPFLEIEKIKDEKVMFESKLNLLFQKLSDKSSDYYKSSIVYL